MNKHHGIVYYRMWQAALPLGFVISFGVQLAAFLKQEHGLWVVTLVLFLAYAAWADWKLRDLDRQLDRDEARIRKQQRQRKEE